jgi:hypothetical protein
MKKIITLAMALMLGVLFMTGCSKKSDSPSYSMKATAGGTAISANNASATLAGGSLAIAGINSSGGAATPPYISMTIVNFTGTGTYNIDASGTVASASYFPDSDLSHVKISKTGSIVVTSSSSASVSGTFSFTTTDGTSVTGGTFTAKRY